MVYQDEDGLMDLPPPRLPGRHQFANAAAAIAAVQGGRLPGQRARRRHGDVERVDWPGRMQRLPQGRLLDLAPAGAEIWLDGGHNPGAGIVIAEALAEQEEKDPAAAVPDHRHDQHQGPDRLFPCRSTAWRAMSTPCR